MAPSRCAAPPRSDLVAGARPLPLAQPDAPLPAFVAACPVAQHYRALLGDLAWAQFPDLPPDRTWSRPERVPRAAFVAAYLVKAQEGKPSMPALRAFLLQHPALVWLLGFPLVPDPTASHGFDVAATVPTRRQFSRVLRDLHPEALQFLLTSSITLLHDMLSPDDQAHFGAVVAGDTKHILAWVKENNPRQYVSERFDPQRQPVGDPDCKLGVKRRTNQGRRPTATTDCLGERHVDTWSARWRACGTPQRALLSHPGCHRHQRGMIPCPRNQTHAPIQAAAGLRWISGSSSTPEGMARWVLVPARFEHTSGDWGR
jgi:hypothetical protein